MGPPGFFQNSGELAIQMLMFAPVSYEILLFLKSYVTRGKYMFIALFPITAAMTVIGASSRGGQIGLALEAYLTLLRGKLSVRKVLIIGVVGYAAFLLLPQEQIDRFRSAGDDETSQQRLLYWQRGMQMIHEHPVLGVGYFNFPDYFKSHYPQDLHFRHAELPHNIFIQVGTDAGWLGLAVFAALMWRTIRVSQQIKKLAAHDKTKPFGQIARGLATAMWGFVIAGQFVSVTYYPFFWINLALMVALKHTVMDHYGKDPTTENRRFEARAQRAQE
jgi:O-antigen ligase